MFSDGSRVRRWQCRDFTAALTHYVASGSHPPHHHDHHQVSFLLGGEFAERLEGRDYQTLGIARGNKPAGAVHADDWGEDGALIFTLRLDEGDEELHDAEPGWAAVEKPACVPQLVRAFIGAADEAARREAAADLLALDRDEAKHGSPPAWLERARRALRDAPEMMGVEDAAREAGVHRVQLSRAFQSFYNLPPSLYRRRAHLSRAIGRLLHEDRPIAEIAVAAGFSDQAHLTRSLRAETGLSPAQLRALYR